MPEGVTNKTGKDGYLPNGNFTYREDFSAENLDFRWFGLRGPREEFIKKTKKGLEITPFSTNIKELKPTSTLFYRQQHKSFSFTTTMEYQPKFEKDMAGVTAYQNEGSNYAFGITKKGKEYYLVLQKNSKPNRRGEIISEIVAKEPIKLDGPVSLKISAEGDNYQFSYTVDGSDFKTVGGMVSGDILSTDVAGGFTGAMLGLYATSDTDIVLD